MKEEELKYQNLKKRLSPYEEKGRGESIAFLNWFLENIYRLDSVEADDVICDQSNDKGIDGIYVHHGQEEIHVLQGKLKQKESSIGDSGLRDLTGTITQLDSEASIQSLFDGSANPELKRVLTRNNVRSLIRQEYKVLGIFVSSQPLDKNGAEFRDQCDNIDVYDRKRIAREFVDIDAAGGVVGTYSFDASYIAPMTIRTGRQTVTYVMPVLAKELVGMWGIDDGTLFAQNVRLSLGNTKVNKALHTSVIDKDEHKNFPLFHNGVNILCEKAELDQKAEKLEIENYVVVNGAQSIATFKKSASSLSDDLRVIAKIIQITDTALSKKITVNSNNQNAIKPRDLKSTNNIQLRLKEDFRNAFNGNYDFEIKRGQESSSGATVITNEEAGRLLLAFDLMQPESCHQVYKLFDDKYSDIFARPEVDSYRIVLLSRIMECVVEAMSEITYKPLSKYGLTRFFLLSIVSELVRSSAETKRFFNDPKVIFEENLLDRFLNGVREILNSIVVDLNYEVEDAGDQFDYKSDLKSPAKIRELQSKLLRSYEKDVKRGKAKALSNLIA